MPRAIPAWQYLAFGTLWLILGGWIILGSALIQSSIQLIEIAFGAFVLGVGLYWLRSFARDRRRWLSSRPTNSKIR